MKKILTILPIGSLLLLSLNCMAQEEVKKLYKQEKLKEEHAKYDGKGSITIIRDSLKVKNIKADIFGKIEKGSLEKSKEVKPPSLSDKYRAGDKSVVPEIIQILKGNDIDERHKLYFGLGRQYDDTSDYAIVEPELIKTIIDNFDHSQLSEDEFYAMYVIGSHKFPGYVQLFEAHLLSGQSQYANRLFWQLGSEGSSYSALDYVEKQILEGKIYFDESGYIMGGFRAFSESRDQNIRNKVFEVCVEIYRRKLVPLDGFEINYPDRVFFSFLLELDDDRVIPIANELIDKGIMPELAFNALVRVEGLKHKDQVLKTLRNPETWINGVDGAQILYQKTKDELFVREVLEGWEKKGDSSANYQIVSILIEMGAKRYLEQIDKFIKDPHLVTSIKKIYALTKWSAADMANDLYQMGIVSKPYDQHIIDQVNVLNKNDSICGYIYFFMPYSGIYTTFDAENDQIPVAYDELIRNISKNSDGKFDDILVWMDTEINKKPGIVKYKISLVFNNRAYIAYPQDNEDWFDVQVVLDLLNTALRDSGMAERFVMTDSGDQTVELFFGPEEKVRAFIAKYHL